MQTKPEMIARRDPHLLCFVIFSDPHILPPTNHSGIMIDFRLFINMNPVHNVVVHNGQNVGQDQM